LCLTEEKSCKSISRTTHDNNSESQAQIGANA